MSEETKDLPAGALLLRSLAKHLKDPHDPVVIGILAEIVFGAVTSAADAAVGEEPDEEVTDMAWQIVRPLYILGFGAELAAGAKEIEPKTSKSVFIGSERALQLS